MIVIITSSITKNLNLLPEPPESDDETTDDGEGGEVVDGCWAVSLSLAGLGAPGIGGDLKGSEDGEGSVDCDLSSFSIPGICGLTGEEVGLVDDWDPKTVLEGSEDIDDIELSEPGEPALLSSDGGVIWLPGVPGIVPEEGLASSLGFSIEEVVVGLSWALPDPKGPEPEPVVGLWEDGVVVELPPTDEPWLPIG